MKIALINDLHYGARNDSVALLDYQKKFYDEYFFPRLESEGISQVFILGDLVDRRKYINYYTARRMRTDFVDKLEKYQVYLIPGNHDIFYKTTTELNALDEMLQSRPNYTIINDPTEIDLGPKILMCPWITEYNYEKSMTALSTSSAQYCFGHFEIEGFEMYQGSYCEHGMSPKVFDRFPMVTSGHFHKKSSLNNIHYLGATHEMIWSDYNCPRGFHLLDLDKQELEFIQNPYRLFNKVVYSDSGKELVELMNIDFEYYNNTYVKIIVESKTNPFWFDEFVNKFEAAGTIDVKVIEHNKTYLEKNNLTVSGVQDTLTILLNELRDGDYDRKRVETLFKELYTEAQHLEV